MTNESLQVDGQGRYFWSVDSRFLNRGFNMFIGIDQTGASMLGGRAARPLPIAVLERKQKKLRLHLRSPKSERRLEIAGFSKDEFTRALEELKLDCNALAKPTTAILADCVFGLSEKVWPGPPGAETLRSLFARAALSKDYGLKPAARFFDEILAEQKIEKSLYPVRRCEMIANANSVFRTHPFQKNIQCGTYRIWRDLGIHGSAWLHLRYFEKAAEAQITAEKENEQAARSRQLNRIHSPTRPFLFEAYPSLMWKRMLKLRSRDLTQFKAALELTFKDRLEVDETHLAQMLRDPDHTDAAALALGGAWLAERNELIDGGPSRSKWLAKEGWIVGLDRRA